MGEGVIRACQRVERSGQKYENMGAGDGIIFMRKIPYFDSEKICAEGADAEEAKARLNNLIAGSCQQTLIIDCRYKRVGSVKTEEVVPIWKKIAAFITKHPPRFELPKF